MDPSQEARMNNPAPQRKFDYRGFVIAIEVTGNGDQISARADLEKDGAFAGRVALTACQDDREALFDKLGHKTKELIDGLLAGGKPAAVGGAGRQLLEARCP